MTPQVPENPISGNRSVTKLLSNIPNNFAHSKYAAIEKLIKQNKTANQNLVTNRIHFGDSAGEDPGVGSRGYSTTSWPVVSLILIGKQIFFVKVHATDL